MSSASTCDYSLVSLSLMARGRHAFRFLDSKLSETQIAKQYNRREKFTVDTLHDNMKVIYGEITETLRDSTHPNVQLIERTRCSSLDAWLFLLLHSSVSKGKVFNYLIDMRVSFLFLHILAVLFQSVAHFSLLKSIMSFERNQHNKRISVH